MEGRLFTLSRDGVRRTSLLMAGTSHRCILVVGSQMDAFFATPYAQDLANELTGEWSVAHVELGSCRVGYGGPNHESDADDVNAALELLMTQCKVSEVVLYGSGTGVQVVLAALVSGSQAHVVSRVVLHGGVVPPEANPHFSPAALQERRTRAAELIAQGRGEDMAAMGSLYDIPITPARLCYDSTLTVQEALWQPAVEGDERACRAALRGIVVPVLFLLATDVKYGARAASELPGVRSAAVQAIGLSSDDVQVELLPSSVDEHRRVLRGGGRLVAAAVREFLARADVRREERRIQAEAEAKEAERRRRIELAKAMYA